MDPVQLPKTGDRFLDRWVIEGEVGRGGFSVVYRATDARGRVAAVKILLPESGYQAEGMSYDGELADRFLREARLLEQLDSPYTINMWEYGESPAGWLYMIFEFIDGRSLFDDIKQQGALAPERVVHILRQTLIGLNSAHQLGILHRDIKPNNVMLFEREGDPDRVKLVDFGIAKMYGEAKAMPGNDLTAAGLLVGTPRYMSPEQLKGQSLGPPSDLYSLGLCGIEMLTGRKCIPGKDRMKIIEIQLHPEPITLPADADAGPGLRNVVHTLTQKKLELRYSSAAQALRDLEALAGDPGATGDTVFEPVPASLEIPSTAPKQGEEETVLHRVNTAELDALIAEQGGESADPYDPTVAATAAMTAADSHQNLGNTQPVSPDASYGSGQFSASPPDQRGAGSGEYGRTAPPAAGSGEYNQSGGHASGEYNHPRPVGHASGEVDRRSAAGFDSGDHGQQAPTGFGSGEYTQPPPTGFGSGEYDQPPPTGFGSGEYDQRAPTGLGSGEHDAPLVDRSGDGLQPASSKGLESDEKLALGASVLLPGLGHLLLKQTYKGIGAIALLVFTLGVGWVILAPLAFIDAFLVIRAQRRRDVGDLEFFPDYQDLL